jgi:hypothetical protein
VGSWLAAKMQSFIYNNSLKPSDSFLETISLILKNKIKVFQKSPDKYSVTETKEYQMKVQIWIDADTKLEYGSEIVAWKKYMHLNEKRKSCMIAVPRPNGQYEVYSKFLLKSCIVSSEKEVMKVVGSFL